MASMGFEGVQGVQEFRSSKARIRATQKFKPAENFINEGCYKVVLADLLGLFVDRFPDEQAVVDGSGAETP
jgi:hypothetical protein